MTKEAFRIIGSKGKRFLLQKKVWWGWKTIADCFNAQEAYKHMKQITDHSKVYNRFGEELYTKTARELYKTAMQRYHSIVPKPAAEVSRPAAEAISKLVPQPEYVEEYTEEDFDDEDLLPKPKIVVSDEDVPKEVEKPVVGWSLENDFGYSPPSSRK